MQSNTLITTLLLLSLRSIDVAASPTWASQDYPISFDEEIVPARQSLQVTEPHKDPDSLLFNSFGVIDPQLIQYYCSCIDMQFCPAAISVFKTKPTSRQDIDLIRLFTCGYDGFRPQICCNLFIESLIYRKNRKQKRAHYNYGGYERHGYRHNNNRYPQTVRDKTQHHFFWDGESFPHWSHAPNDPYEYDGHDCWSPHEFESRGTLRTTARPSRPAKPIRPGRPVRPRTRPVTEAIDEAETTIASFSLPEPTTTAEPTTTSTTTEATTTTEVVTTPPVDPIVEPPVVDPPVVDPPSETPNVVTTTPAPETTTSQLTGNAAKRALLSDQRCGTTIQSRIVGGEDAKLGDYPWMARLGYRRGNQPNILFRCGGSLISERYVISAAHCVTNLPVGLELVTIRLGELDERSDRDCEGDFCSDPPQDFAPSNVSVHPSYNNPRLSNDISIIQLSSVVQFNGFISPLCLPFRGSAEDIPNLTGLSAIVAGWGSTNTGVASGSPTLKWVRLNIIPTEQCIVTYRTRFDITVSDQQICTGGVENMDACEGDSGGPLFLGNDDNRRATLIGIVSFGPRRCGTAALPGVYTRVQSYLDWVLDSIEI